MIGKNEEYVTTMTPMDKRINTNKNPAVKNPFLKNNEQINRTIAIKINVIPMMISIKPCFT
ncbi:hypothetical protein D3C78_1056510 [compost metagenome]